MLTDVRFSQPWNALAGITAAPDPRVTLCRLWQFIKALAPMAVTLSGSSTFSSAEVAKAKVPMDRFRSVGKVIPAIPAQEKALGPMAVRLSGRFT